MDSLTLKRWLLLTFLSPWLAACGYRPGYGAISEQYSSISVPYVSGDVDGSLTAAIVHEVSASLGFEHSLNGGQLLLIVQLVDVASDNIGFRYEQLHGKQYKRSIIPVESRLTAKAEISLVDAATSCTVLPPVCISAYVDLDHEYNATYTDSNVFSLGQLSDSDAAFAAARAPLHKALAKKIVEYISLR